MLTFLGADFEGESASGDDSYDVTVTATDGASNVSMVKAFEVQVTNVNEAPSIAAPPVQISTAEDAAATITNAQLKALVSDAEFKDNQLGAAVTLSVI